MTHSKKKIKEAISEIKQLRGIMKGHKDTTGKLPLNLVPPRAYESIAIIRDFGNKKYGDPWGWLEHVTEDSLFEAIKRHALRIDLGELYDPESGRLHHEHMLCGCAMLVELVRRRLEK